MVFETNTAMRPEVSRVLALVAMTAAAKVRSKIMCAVLQLCVGLVLLNFNFKTGELATGLRGLGERERKKELKLNR